MRAIIRNSKPLQSPQRLLALTFAAAIAIGAALLATPAANADGRWHVGIDALFLSTSAVCVTGLDSIGIGASLSRFGLGVMLLLVELGGLGIMTVGTFFFIAMGRRLSRSGRRRHDFPRRRAPGTSRPSSRLLALRVGLGGGRGGACAFPA